MKLVYKIFVVLIVLLTYSCSKDTPSVQFFPDMYYPVAYDPYQEAVVAYSDEINEVPLFVNNNGKTALNPVKGTVARNNEFLLPTELDNTPEDYAKSKAITESPLAKADSLNDRTEDLKRGKKLYDQTCAVCHGVNGDGQGPIVQSGAYLGVPNYQDREISIGSVHHVLTYGKNAMGSYAAHLSPSDRWRVAEYVMEFKK